MTLDEMIKAMNGHLVEMREAAPQIIAALRRLDRLEKAGQALRDWPYTPNKSWNEVSKAWDAAAAKGKK